MNFLRRGSRKSLVKEVHITSAANTESKRVLNDGDMCQLNLHQPEPTLQCDNIDYLKECLKKAEKELQRSKAENERLENARISINDSAEYFERMCNEKEAEILSLATENEVLKLRNNDLETEQRSESHKAKTQHMASVEEELNRVGEESRMKIRQLQKKIRRLQETHAKSKQDYALKVFALKDENRKLMETNEALEDRLRLQAGGNSNENSGETRPNDSDEDNPCTPRNQLVIQLSQQVTTLHVENQELRQELEKTKQLLQKLQPKERRIRTRSRTTHERQQLCVNMTGLDVGSSQSKVELRG